MPSRIAAAASARILLKFVANASNSCFATVKSFFNFCNSISELSIVFNADAISFNLFGNSSGKTRCFRARLRIANRRSSTSSIVPISVDSGLIDSATFAIDCAASYSASICSEYGFLPSVCNLSKICATSQTNESNEFPFGFIAFWASFKIAAFFSAFIIFARIVANSASSPGRTFNARNSATLCSKNSRSDAARATKSCNRAISFSIVCILLYAARVPDCTFANSGFCPIANASNVGRCVAGFNNV